MTTWARTLGVVVAVTCCLASVASASLVSSWDFNEGTGTATSANESGIANAAFGTYGGGSQPTWVAGQSGNSGDYALDFVGTRYVNGYATSPTTGLYDFAVDGEFSVAAWLKMPQPGDTSGIVNTLGAGITGWGLVAFNNGSIKIEVKPNSSVSGNPGLWYYGATSLMDDTEWFHVAATYEGLGLIGGTTHAALNIYINGNATPVATTVLDFGVDLTGQSFSDNALYFGAYGDQLRGYTGSLDDVRIFDHALTGAEVTALVVPEPSVFALLVGGLAALCWIRRRRR